MRPLDREFMWGHQEELWDGRLMGKENAENRTFARDGRPFLQSEHCLPGAEAVVYIPPYSDALTPLPRRINGPLTLGWKCMEVH
jgi:hypothetical protein